MADEAPGTATVTDRRTPPRGVLPRGAQTWLMAGLALGILGIIVVTGRPEPPARVVQAPTATSNLSPDRLRDYQERLRVLDERSRPQAVLPPPDPTAPLLYERAGGSSTPVDPLEAEKQRRDYESLFATNVVLSRRTGTERVVANELAEIVRNSGSREALTPPTLDEVAEAVMRATARTPASGASPTAPESPPIASAPVSTHNPTRTTPVATPPIDATGPRHRLLEGTIIDAVLTNRLDGSSASPVNALVTNPVYSHSGQHVLIPAGARVLGETKPVQAFGETRLAVLFHRVLFPDGRTYALDQFAGLNQVGDAGLRDRVNQHYWSTFGASAAVGLVTGLSQFLGSVGFGGGTGDRTIVIAGGVGTATSQATAQVMNRFSNRLPTITIREGHRLKVYLTSDLELPAYAPTRARTQR